MLSSESDSKQARKNSLRRSKTQMFDNFAVKTHIHEVPEETPQVREESAKSRKESKKDRDIEMQVSSSNLPNLFGDDSNSKNNTEIDASNGLTKQKFGIDQVRRASYVAPSFPL